MSKEPNCHNTPTCIATMMVLALVCLCPPSYSQEGISGPQFVPVKWDNTNGLPVNSVFQITQDQLGYLWIISEEGLIRFDGVDFKIFDASNIPGLHTPRFYDLTLASDGGVWAATANSIVHASNSKIITYDARAEADGTWITSLEEGHAGFLWAGTNSGALYRLVDGKLETIPQWNGLGKDIKTIIRTPKGMAIGTEDGVFLYDKEKEAFQAIPALKGIEVRTLTCHPDSTLWVGTRTHGIFHLADGGITVIDTTNGLANNHVNTLYAASDGQVWAGMVMGGVQRIEGHQPRYLKEKEFRYNEIRDIFISRDGILWFAAVGEGVLQMIPAPIRTLGVSDGLSMDISLAIYQDKHGVVWTGTAGAGVNRIENGQITHITKEDGLINGILLGIYGVDDYLYFGSGNGLNRYNPVTEKIDRAFTTSDGLASNTVQVIYQDSQKRVWITSRSGGIHLLHNHERIERLPVPREYSNTEFTNVLEDSKGNLWVGSSSKGLLRISPDGQMTPFPIYKGPSSEMVYSIYEDPEGSIWVGTIEGLLVLDQGKFRLLDQHNGLHFNGVFRIIPDNYGYVWLSGNFGIQSVALADLMAWKHNPSEKGRVAAHLYDTSDGMINREANGGVFPAGWKMDNGDIWFPTMEGIAIVSPQALHREYSEVDVYIEALRYGEQELYPQDLPIVIPPGVYNMEVHFGSLDFRNPHTIDYSYRLVNLHDDWRMVSNRTVAYFSTLAPGRYTFEVRAEQFGRTSATASIDFSVEPFIYQTLWFKVLLVIALVLIGYLTSRFYIKVKLGRVLSEQVRLKTEELESRNKMLQQALNSIARQNNVLKEVAWVQSHELRGPLSRMMGLTDVARNFSRFKKINKDRDQIIEEIAAAANEMDDMLRKLNKSIEELEKRED